MVVWTNREYACVVIIQTTAKMSPRLCILRLRIKLVKNIKRTEHYVHASIQDSVFQTKTKTPSFKSEIATRATMQV